jgi:phage gpG-like protein
MASKMTARINLNGFKVLKKQAAIMQKSYIAVGVLGNESNRSDGESNAMIGAIHEFGSLTRNIVARPWLAFTIKYKSKEISAFAGKVLKREFAKRSPNLNLAFNQIGLFVISLIQEAFDTGGFGTWTPLSQKTIDAKGSDAILIDTGSLRRSVSHEVKTK